MRIIPQIKYVGDSISERGFSYRLLPFSALFLISIIEFIMLSMFYNAILMSYSLPTLILPFFIVLHLCVIAKVSITLNEQASITYKVNIGPLVLFKRLIEVEQVNNCRVLLTDTNVIKNQFYIELENSNTGLKTVLFHKIIKPKHQKQFVYVVEHCLGLN